MFTSLFYKENMITTLGLQCSELLAHGDHIINTRNCPMSAERTEYGARAKAVLSINENAFKEDTLLCNNRSCLSAERSARLALTLTSQNLGLRAVSNEEIENTQLELHKLQAIIASVLELYTAQISQDARLGNVVSSALRGSSAE
ncbi:hypothetical protein QAD02_005661 [Eretmocerus hayati]|uniref:Uncharacterized protein n=1 Tax=Eretmocerus hayati TaxID=131215 RepID=A0ACC2NTI9_9HYME|nr:hypothetical protein QAD02_005661 [Eretmocerus hayati]